jgi:hypothetical protein
MESKEPTRPAPMMDMDFFFIGFTLEASDRFERSDALPLTPFKLFFVNKRLQSINRILYRTDGD